MNIGTGQRTGSRTARPTRWAVAVVLAGLSVGLAGCVQSIPFSELPPLGGEDRKVLTTAEQAKAMEDLKKLADQRTADTLRQIETGSIKSP